MMIPWRLRRALRPAQFTCAAHLMNARRPSPWVLRWLRAGWSNEGWSGDPAFLTAVWKHALQAHRILECGSGLSTLVLGKVIGETGAELWSLEHSPEWQQRVNAVLSSYRLPNRVSFAPLVSYGTFDWYELPEGLPSTFDLVVCDGPPADSRRGRYGLLPVCLDRIAGATILLDDADRESEIKTMALWGAQAPLHSRIVSSSDGAYAVLSVSDRRRQQPTQ